MSEEVAQYPLISSNVSDDVARILVECYRREANPPHSHRVGRNRRLDCHRSSDAVFLGVLASAEELLAKGELVELLLEPEAGLSVQLALIVSEGRAEPPALNFVRDFCLTLAHAEIGT